MDCRRIAFAFLSSLFLLTACPSQKSSDGSSTVSTDGGGGPGITIPAGPGQGSGPSSGNGGGPAKIGFTLSGKPSPALGSCEAYQLGLSAALGAATQVQISAASGGFFSDAKCGSSITSLSLGPSDTSQSFYYQNTSAGKVTLSASVGGKVIAGIDLNLAPGAPARFGITGPASGLPGACNGPFALAVVDAFGNVTAADSMITAMVSYDSSQSIAARIFSDSQCTQAISGHTFSTGQAAKPFWVSTASAQALGLYATDLSSRLLSALYPLPVLDPGGARLAFGYGRADVSFAAGQGSVLEKKILLTNLGQTTATGIHPGSGLNGGLAFKGGTYPGTGGNCGATLPKATSCTVVLRFAPPVQNPKSGYEVPSQLVLAYDQGSVTTQVDLTAPAPAVALSFQGGQVLAFAPNYNGAGIALVTSLYLTNIGATPITNLAAPLTGGMGPISLNGPFPGAGGTCGTTLNPGATCSITAVFTPPAGSSEVDNLGFVDITYTFNGASVDDELGLIALGVP